MNRIFYGIKLTDDSVSYTAYNVVKTEPHTSYLISIDKTNTLKAGWTLIPIPQFQF